MKKENLLALAARTSAAGAVAIEGMCPPLEMRLTELRETAEAMRLTEKEIISFEPAWNEAWDREVEELLARRPLAQWPIGPRLRELVDESSFTILELARRFGFTRQYMYKIFTGEANPSAGMIAQMLDAIGCQWGDLDTPARAKV